MIDELENLPGLLVCSQTACLGIKDQQPKASGSRTALVLDGVLQAQPGSLSGVVEALTTAGGDERQPSQLC